MKFFDPSQYRVGGAKFLDTTQYLAGGQRTCPIETVGMVIGTAGTPAFVHLQLESARRFFGDSLPVLIVNDGDDSETVNRLCGLVQIYGFADLAYYPSIGHCAGDVRVFQRGLQWAEDLNIDILVKLSRRFIPLVNWRYQLLALASLNRDVAAFTRRNGDRPDGLFRTDAIALRVRKWQTDRIKDTLAETLKHEQEFFNVEALMLALTKTGGGWALWDLLGPDFSRAHAAAMQWRGCLPIHYADLAREWGLPYTEKDFGDCVWVRDVGETDLRTVLPPVSGMKVVEDPRASGVCTSPPGTGASDQPQSSLTAAKGGVETPTIGGLANANA